MADNEQDVRLAILNTLLTTPHRQLDSAWPIHQEMCQSDPRFYVRLGTWYFDEGDVRDHKELFIINLILSDFEGHREVGLALLRQLPPYQVARVVDFIKGKRQTIKVKAKDNKQPVEKIEKFGLFRNPPRSLRTEVMRYLKEREAEPEWFDGCVLVARKAMKRLYAVLHVPPGERAQKVLFEEAPPADSRLAALKALARAGNPEEQARVIRENALPYRVAATVVTSMTPPVLAALIDRMTPQELINTLGALKKRGALELPDLKAKIDAKLEQARRSERVSALKAEEAVKAVDLPQDVRHKLEDVADTQLKGRGRIERPVALLIDKSGSMEVAIELGKRIGAMLSAVCVHTPTVVAFDTLPFPITPGGTDLASWEKAMRGITAGGNTACGVGLDYLRRKRIAIEQIILITDEGENAGPFFVPTFQKYREELRVDPTVCIVRTPNAGQSLTEKCRQAGIEVDAFHFTGDYYSLPGLIPLLRRPSKLELLLRIMEYPLPQRRA